MRLKRLIIFIAMVISAQQGTAATGFDPATLGHMKGVLEMCGATNRQAASQYLLQMKALIGSATRQEIDKVRKTQAYQVAYQSVRNELSNRSPQELASACSSYLAEGD